MSELDQGSHIGTDATFKDVTDRWLMISGADLESDHTSPTPPVLDQHILPALGDRAAHKIRTSDLDDLYLGLVNRTGLSPASVRQVHSVVRRALSQAVRWGWISTNPRC